MRKLLLSIVFSLLVFAGFSQKYIPGYILTNEGDTIHGELLKQNNVDAGKQCTFKNVSGEIKTFLPMEINEYRYQDGNYYVSKEIEIDSVQTPTFLSFLLKGTIELYVYYAPENQAEIFYVKKEDKLVKLENNVSFIYKNGSTYRKYDKKYIGALKYLYGDAPEIIKEVDKLSFSSGSLIKISEEYHNYVCNDESCEIFKRKKKMHFGLKPAVSYNKTTLFIDQKIENYIYNNEDISTDDEYYKTDKTFEYKSNYAYSYGMGLNISSPDKRFKIEYSIGMQHSSFQNTQLREHFPLQVSEYLIKPDYLHALNLEELTHDFEISYAFTYNKIQPYISLGILSSKVKVVSSDNNNITSLFPEKFTGPIGRVGIKYSLSEKIFFELNVYSSSLSCRKNKEMVTQAGPGTSFYLMRANYKQLGLNISATFFPFSNTKKK